LGIGPHSSLVIVLVGIDNTDLDGSVCVKLIRASDGFIRWRIGADRSSVYSVSLSLPLSLSLCVWSCRASMHHRYTTPLHSPRPAAYQLRLDPTNIPRTVRRIFPARRSPIIFLIIILSAFSRNYSDYGHSQTDSRSA